MKVTPKALIRATLWVILLGIGACTATQRQEAKTVVCHVCDKVADYCNNGAPLTDAQKQEIVQELYPDAGK
jgi:hypothetical protein